MDYSFTRYLLAKQTVDDRALNKDVVQALRDHLPSEPISVIEVGAGIGTMLKRLVAWDLFRRGRYILVDSMQVATFPSDNTIFTCLDAAI